VTAATKAKVTRPAPTAAKRKLRSEDADLDDDHDELDSEQPQPLIMKATTTTVRGRGRPKKMETAVSEPTEEAPPPRARGRPPKKAAPEPVVDAPARATRTTRAKKADADEGEARTATEPAKKVTRARAATVTKSAAKKTVTFEEPEKENIVPAAASKGKAVAKATDSAAGMRAKPVRRAVATTARATRTTRAGAVDPEAKAPLPLSPKKVTQIRLPRDVESDDELGAVDKFPPKPLSRNQIKPPVLGGASKPSDSGSESITQPTVLGVPALPVTILASPARRPPPSPYKDAMRSPARRVDGAVFSPSKDAQTAPANLKASLLQSPAKRPPRPAVGLDTGAGREDTLRSPLKMSLLQSPAKRPFSPMKIAQRSTHQESNGVGQSPAPKPTLLATPGLPTTTKTETSVDDDLREALEEMDEDAIPSSPTRLRFPGRLSAILPRHADPELGEAMPAVDETDEDTHEDPVESLDSVDDIGDPMEVDEVALVVEEPVLEKIPPPSPPKRTLGMFSLRQRDLNPYQDVESESEDELAPGFAKYNDVPATPCPAGSSRTPRTAGGRARSSRRSTMGPAGASGFGFTPLAEQLSGWRANSPQKSAFMDQAVETGTPHDGGNISPVTADPTVRNTFFDDAMSVQPHAALQDVVEAASRQNDDESDLGDIETPEFEEMPITHEDVALAAEADEMSVMEPERLEELINAPGLDDSISDASQEYGDENDIPIDPALLAGDGFPGVPPVTPQRVITRTVHTVSKVPLKAADESTPRPNIRKRAHSISRLPTSVQRPVRNLTRNATVISYSPSKKDRQQVVFDDAASSTHAEEINRPDSAPPVTPSKSEGGWSTAVTPAQTPQREVNPALLRGAVVFVDVHTTEGADASGIFVDLLNQMGARCVKSWSWNPSSPPGKDGQASKVGITHVVYKDGGKRTMEKVRESGGVVQCVGVTWVLE